MRVGDRAQQALGAGLWTCGALFFGFESTRALSTAEAAVWIGCAVLLLALAGRCLALSVEVTDTEVVVRGLLRTRRAARDEVSGFGVSDAGWWLVAELCFRDDRRWTVFALAANRNRPSTVKELHVTITKLNAVLGVGDSAGSDGRPDGPVEEAERASPWPYNVALAGMLAATMPVSATIRVMAIAAVLLCAGLWYRLRRRG